MHDLTVCSVSFNNAPQLSLNWQLAKRLNTDFDRCRWVIAENSPADSPHRLHPNDRRFELLPGASSKLVPNYQHTEALHECLRRVDTRFVLVLDPDFYIVRSNWIREILEEMKEKDLSFFGVPWHPRNTDKYRYFPCVHCLFIDQDRVPLDQIDLRPGQQDTESKFRKEFRDPESITARTESRSWIGEWLWHATGLYARRKDYCDTGTRFYYRFHKDRLHAFELALPVLRLPSEAPVNLSWRGKLLELLLPDSLCYLPKRRASYSTTGLRERGYLRSSPSDWEEFVWKNAPFGFHIRRNRDKHVRNEEAEVSALACTLNEFAPGLSDEEIDEDRQAKESIRA